MIQIPIHKVEYSVINLIEQTQGSHLPSVSQTTKLTLTQRFRTATIYYPANPNEAPLTTSTRETNAPTGQNICIETPLVLTWGSKYFPARGTAPRPLAALTQLPASESQTST